MWLSCFSEGTVDTALGNIVNTKNDTAARIGKAADLMGYPEPDVEFAHTSDNDVNIWIELGRNRHFPESQVMTIKVSADDDIVINVPQTISNEIMIQPYHKLGSDRDTIGRLKKIKASILRFLRNR